MINNNENQLQAGNIEIDKEGNVVHLILENKSLSSFPPSFVEFTHLKRLQLAHNQLTYLPESVDNFTQLEWLDLSHNHLTTLPDSIGNLTNLKVLLLGNNQLSTLPDSIRQLTNLKTLKLPSNNLHSVPESFFLLKKLVTLSLGDNQLASLPDSISLLVNLSELELWKNKLSILPVTLDQIIDLKSLILAKNCFSIVPSVLGNLTNLKALDLTDNPMLDTCSRLYSGSSLEELLTTLKTVPLNLQLHELLTGISIVKRMKDHGFSHTTLDQSYPYYEQECEKWSLEKHNKELFFQHLEPFKLQRILFEKQEGEYVRFYLGNIPNLTITSLIEILEVLLRHKLR